MDGTSIRDWRWHEKEGAWIASYKGIAVKVDRSPEKGPPHFTAQAWVEGTHFNQI